MKKTSKRILTMLLAVLMIVGQFPMSAFAAGEAKGIPQNAEEQTISVTLEYFTVDPAGNRVVLGTRSGLIYPVNTESDTRSVPGLMSNEVDGVEYTYHPAEQTITFSPAELAAGGAAEATVGVEYILDDLYIVRFYSDKENGTLISTHEYTLNEKVELADVPEVITRDAPDGKKVSYQFQYWEDENGNMITKDTLVTSNLNVYPHYNQIDTVTVKILLMYGEKEINRVELQYKNTETGEVSYSIPTKIIPDEEHRANKKFIYPDSDYVTFTPSEIKEELTIPVQYYDADSEALIRYIVPESDQKAERVLAEETIEGKSGNFIIPEILDFTEEHAVHDTAKGYDRGKDDAGLIFLKGEKQVVNVYYKDAEVSLNYNTNGGSYIPQKIAAYGDTVEVFKSESHEELTCGKEEHRHTYTNKYNSYYKGGCYGDDWTRNPKCGKQEHEHSNACYTDVETVASPIPKKEGYTFVGWYLDEACTQPAESSMTLNGDVTVYAKWEEATADYTILYRKQNNRNEYDYVTTVTGRGKVGATIQAQAANVSEEVFRNQDFYHFIGGSGVIAADNSTVIYADYDLNTYKFEFHVNASGETLTRDGKTYKDSDKKYYTITARLGDDIAEVWPLGTDLSKTGFVGWVDTATAPSGTETLWTTKRYEVTTDMVDEAHRANNSTIVKYVRYASINHVQYNYYLQDAETGEYVLSTKYSQDLPYDKSRTISGSAKTLKGFTYNSEVSASHNSGVDPNGQSNTKNGKIVKTVYDFYYDRNKYIIDYYSGTEKIDSKTGIFFDKDINKEEYKAAPGKQPTNVDSEAIFKGWYSDPECLGEQYNFDKMPDHNLVLYAKYVLPEKTVTFDPNGGKVIVDGKESDSTSQTVLKFETVDEIEDPVRPGYVFKGWYTSKTVQDTSTKYDFNAPVTKDMTLYANWEKEKTYYTVYYVYDGKDILANKVVTANEDGSELQVGQLIKETAPEIWGYRVDVLEQELTLGAKNDLNVMQFIYSEKTEIPYSVRYVAMIDGVETEIKETDEFMASEDLITVVANTKNQTLGYEGKTYYVTNDPQKLKLTSDPKKNVVTLLYAPYGIGTVRINYIDKYDNSVLEPYTEQSYPIGVSFSLKGKDAEGNPYIKDIKNYMFYELRDTNYGSIVVSTKELTNVYVVYVRDTSNIVLKGFNEVYDGTSYSIGVEADLVEGDKLLYSYDGGETWQEENPEFTNVWEIPEDGVVHVKLVDHYGDEYEVGTAEAMITARPVTVIANSDEKIYDGKPLTNDGWTVAEPKPGEKSGLVEGDTITKVTVTGSQTDAGSSKNVPSDAVFAGDPDAYDYAGKNYAVTYVDGTLTVNPGKAHLTVEKTADVEEGKTAAPGQVITYTIKVTNDGKAVVTGINIYDALTHGEQPVNDAPFDLKPGEYKEVTVTYTVTEQDIVKESVENKATAIGKDPDKEDVTGEDEEDVPTDPKKPELVVTKTATLINGKEIAEDQKAKLGDKITYTINVKNTGNVTISAISVTDTVEGYAEAAVEAPAGFDGTLAPNEDIDYTYEYEVTEADLGKDLKNVATATGKDPEDEDPEVTPGEEDVPTDPKKPELVVTKTATLINGKEIADGQKAKLGDKITYTINVKNTGNVTISAISVTDTVEGYAEAAVEAPAGFDGTLAPNEDIDYTYEYEVTEADLGKELKNVATATGKDPENKDPEVTPGDEDVPTDTKKSSLKVEKTSDVTGTAKLGDKITYTIKVTNDGNQTITNIVVEDKLTGNTGENALEIGTLEPGEFKEVNTEFVVTDKELVAGTVANKAVATGKDPSGKDVTGEGTKDDPTVKADASLTIEKTATLINGEEIAEGQKAKLGDKITYTITVLNNGSVTIHDISVTDTVEGYAEVAVEAPAGFDGTLAPNESKDFTYEYEVTEADLGKELKNVATATGKDPEGGDPEVTPGDEDVPTDPKKPELVVTKTATAINGSEITDGQKAKLGDKITYTINVKNTGNVTISAVSVTDTVEGYAEVAVEAPAGFEGTLAPNEDIDYTYEYEVTEADLGKELKNVATATGKDPEGGDPEVTPGDEDVPTDPKTPKLEVTKKASKINGKDIAENQKAALGDEITYAVKVTNTGNVTVHGVTVTDKVEEYAEVAVEAPADFDGVLEPKESVVYTYQYTVKQDDLDGKLVNVATADGDEDPEVTPGTDDTPTDTQQASLYVKKTSDTNDEPVDSGEKITYTIYVENNGNATIENVVIDDELTGNTQAKAIKVGTLKPGEHVEKNVTYTVTEEDVLNGKVTNVVKVTGTKPDGDPIEDTAEKTDKTKDVDAELEVTKTSDKDGKEVALGETIKYTITVTNKGNVTLKNVEVLDEKTNFEAKIKELAPGKDASFTTNWVVTEEEILAGEILNSVTATADDPKDPENPDGPSDHDDRKDIPEDIKADLEVLKTSDKDGKTVVLDELINYTITVTNKGNVTAKNVHVVDSKTGLDVTITRLPVGETKTFHTTWNVTEADILAGEVYNSVTAVGDEIPDPKDPENPKTPKDDDDDTVDPEPIAPNLKVTKTADRDEADAGETITYTISVKNVGNVTAKNVKVEDEKTALSEIIEELAIGEEKEFTTTYTVTEEDILAQKEIYNVVTAKGDPIEDPKDPDHPKTPEGKDDETVDPKPIDSTLTVTKTSDKDGKKVELGETILYTVIVKNDGNVTAKNVVLSDELGKVEPKTNLTLKDENGEDCALIAELAAGKERTFTAEYTVTEADILAGEVYNSVTAVGDEIPDPKDPENPKTPEGKDDDTVDPKPVDTTLTVKKSSDVKTGETAKLGQKIKYSVTVTNNGNVTVSNIYVTDELTGKVAPDDGEDTRVYVGTLTPGASKTVEVGEYTVAEADVLAGKTHNVAVAEGDPITNPEDPDGDPIIPHGEGTKDDPTEKASASLFVEKTSDVKETAAAGDTITYTIKVTNNGTTTITDIVITDELTGNTGDKAIEVGTLAPGEVAEKTATYVVTEADLLKGEVTNIAVATGTKPDGDPISEEGTKTDKTDDLNPALSVTKESDKDGEKVKLGETITYTVKVKNSGNVTLHNVRVEDKKTGLDETIKELPVGKEETLTTTWEVTEEEILAGEILNSVTAKGDPIPDPKDPENPKTPEDSDKTEDDPEDKNPHITITKETTSKHGDEVFYKVGETIEYKVTVKNDGNLTVTGIKVEDDLTGETWSIDKLEPGETETYTTSYKVVDEDIIRGEVANNATMTEGTSSDPDDPDVPHTDGHTDDKTDPLNTTLKVEKTDDKNGAAVTLGEEISYTITVTNEGNVAFHNVHVVDEKTKLDVNITRLDVGETKTFNTQWTVTEEDILAGEVYNYVTAEADPFHDPEDPENPEKDKTPKDDDDDTVETVEINPNLSVIKTSDMDGKQAGLGDTITYTVTVKNEGNVPFHNVVLVDKIGTVEGKETKLALKDYAPIETLAVGDTKSFTTQWTVTEEDILAGHVLNTVTAKADPIPDPKDPDDPEKAKTPEDSAEKDDETADVNADLIVTKSSDKEGQQVLLGETITYTITAQNAGNVTLKNVHVDDDKTNLHEVIAELEPGEENAKSFTTTWTVTEEDILAGEILNSVTAKGDDIPDPKDPENPKTPTDEDHTEDEPEDINPKLEVVKTTVSKPKNGTVYELDETVKYEITVTNTGNVTLHNVKVDDDKVGLHEVIEELKPGEENAKLFTATWSVTAEEIRKGVIVNDVTAKADPVVDPKKDPSNPDYEKTPEDSDHTEDPTVDPTAKIQIIKSVMNEPKNGTAFVKDEKIIYRLTVINVGNTTVENVRITDEKTGLIDELVAEKLDSEESAFITTEWTVTEAEILAGAVVNAVTVTAEDPTTKDPDDPEKPGTVTDDDTNIVKPEDIRKTLEVIKTSDVPEGETAKLGQTVTYTISVKNTGNVTYYNVAVNDEKTGFSTTVDQLAVGETREFTTSHVITEEDILAGEYLNTATAAGEIIPDPEKPEETVPTDPADDDEKVTTDEKKAGIEIVKTSDKEGKKAGLGETINYTLTVTNTGNVTLENVVVTDEKTGFVSETIDELAPGKDHAVSFETSYTVTEEDILAGKIENTADVTAEDPTQKDPDDPEKPAKVTDDDTRTDEAADLDTTLKVVKKSDKEGQEVKLGEKITYTITVTNEGNVTVHNVKVVDANTRFNAEISELKPGEFKQFETSHVVTEEDLLNGDIPNVVVANGDPIDDPKNPDKPKTPTGNDEVHDEPEDIDTTLVVTKKSDKDGQTVTYGDTISYTITVTNKGNVTFHNVKVDDEKTGLHETIESLAVGQTETFTTEWVVTEEEVNNGEVLNSVVAEGDEIPDPKDPENPKTPKDEDDEKDTPSKEGASLSVKKTSDAEGPAASGSTITYTIRVTNNGKRTVSDITVTDPMVRGEDAVATGLTLKPGEYRDFTVEYTVTEDDVRNGSIENIAKAEGKDPDGNPVENEDSVKNPTEEVKPKLDLVKTTTSTPKDGKAYKLGEVVTYVITVENKGNVTLTNVQVSDAKADFEDTIETLEVGASKDYHVSVTVSSEDVLAGSVVNVATAKADPIDDPKDPENPKTPEDTHQTEDKTEDVNPTLEIEKSSDKDGQEVVLGETITYTITVSNKGNVPLTNVSVDDDKAGLHETIAELAVGAEETFTKEYKVTSEDILAGEVYNSVTAEADPVPDPKNPDYPKTPKADDDDTVDTVEINADLEVEKTSDKDGETVRLGEEITYTITVRNNGNVPLTHVRVNDAKTGFSTMVEELAVADEKDFTTTWTVTDEDVLNGKVINSVTTKADPIPDPDDPENPNTPEDTDTDTVETEDIDPEITVEKVADKNVGGKTEGAKLGEKVTYTIKVSNTGNVPVENVKVADDLTGLTSTIAKLAAGEEKTFTTEWTVTEEDILAGKILNIATAKGNPIHDPKDPENPDKDKTPEGSDDETVETEPVKAELDVEKTTTSKPANGEAYALGEYIEYTITVANKGNVTFTNVQVDDELTDLHSVIDVLPANDKVTYTTRHKVTEEDILTKGEVTNVVTAKADEITDPKTGEKITPEDESEVTDPTVGIDATLEVTKTSDKEGKKVELGEVITYIITVTNKGNITLRNVKVNDEKTGLERAIPELKVGETRAYTTSWTVTEEEVLAGKILNSVTAKGDEIKDPKTDEKITPEDTADTEDTPADIRPELAIEKKSDKNGQAVKLGEVITYTITVKNQGNITIRNVKVSDEKTGLEETIPELKIGETKDFTTTWTVTEKDICAGEVLNTAAAQGEIIPDPEKPEETVPTDKVTDEAKDDTVKIDNTLKVEKLSDVTGVAKLGDKITYTIRVTNEGNVTVSNIRVSDELTGEITVKDEETGKISGGIEVGTLAPGESKEVKTAPYTVQEADLEKGIVKNVAVAAGENPEDVPEGTKTPEGTGEREDPTDTTGSSLFIEKTSDTQNKAVKAGETITYTIHVVNNGSRTVNNVVIEDKLTGNVGADKIKVGTLEPQAEYSTEVKYTVTEEDILNGEVTNIAKATGTGADKKFLEVSDDETDKTEDVRTGLKVEKTSGKTEDVKAGDKLTYTISVTNLGNVTAKNVVVTDEKTGLKKSIGDIAPGETTDITTEWIVTEEEVLSGKVENIAAAKGDPVKDPDDPDHPKTPEGEGKTEDPTEDIDPKLEITKKVAGTPNNGRGYALGEHVKYSITVKNTGNVTLHNVVVADDLTGREWRIEHLDKGQTETCTTEWTVNEQDILNGKVENVATAEADPIPDPKNPGTTKTPEKVEDEADADTDDLKTDLKVEKTSDKDGLTVKAGDKIIYTIKVTNIGNVTAKNVVVTDEKTGLEKNVGDIAVGGSKEVKTEWIVTEAEVLEGKVLNSAAATGDEIPDPHNPDEPKTPSGEGEDDDVKTEAVNPHLSVSKTSSKNGDQAAFEDTITYTIKVKNDGNVALTNVKVDDEKTGLHETIDKLAVGAEETFYTQLKVSEDDVLKGLVVNVATAEADPVKDPKTGENVTPKNEATAEDPTVGYDASLDITKTVDKESGVKAGDVLTYTIIVKNDGTVPVRNITVSDPMISNVPLGTGINLKPGATKTFKDVRYTVTGTDASHGWVTNTATAEGIAPDGRTVYKQDSVTTDVEQTQTPIATPTPTSKPDDRGPTGGGTTGGGTTTPKYDYTVRYVDGRTGEDLCTPVTGQAKAGTTVKAANKKFDGYTYDHADPGTSMVITSNGDNTITVTYMPDVKITVHFVDEKTGEKLKDDAVITKPYGSKDVSINSPAIEGYDPKYDNVWARNLTGDVDVTIPYNRTDDADPTPTPTPTVKPNATPVPTPTVGGDKKNPNDPDDDGNWGVLVDNGDEIGYTIEEIADEEVPLALREQTHIDVFFPFLCVSLTFLTQLYFIRKRKELQEQIYELRANMLCRTFQVPEGINETEEE